ncbi:MAG: hypothetical protein F7C38_04335 [Desulfurococcales archaeon]|nr:hypothetical protein [Desulfurococcales archaeon]
MRSHSVPRIVVKRRGSVLEYALRVIVEFNRGFERIGLIGYGRDVCVLADVVAEVRRRLGGSVEIVGWEIDSRRVGGGRESYLYVELAYRPES